MYPPNTRARCSLHLLLVDSDDRCSDPSGLLAVLGDRAGPAEVVVWTSHQEGPDAPTVLRAADLLDDVEHLTGARPRYREATGDLAALVRAITQRAPAPPSGTILAVSNKAPRRIVRALRRSATAAGAHLALLPPRSTSSHRSLCA